MPKNRNRSTTRASWSVQTMETAIAAIRAGLSIRKASLQYNIPYSSIRDRLKAGHCYKPSLGKKCVFTADEEKEIECHVLKLSKLYFGITQTELRRLAYDFAETNKIKNNFSKQSQLAGKDWLYGFLKRHPALRLRKPEATSINRVLAFNKEEVQHFYSNIELLLSNHFFSPTRIYNVDETGVSTVQTPAKILAPKGMKQVGALTSWERGKNITVCCAFSAAGHYIPPMFIFPRKRMSPQLMHNGPPGAIYHCSTNGWMTTELFSVYLKYFAKQTNASIDNPVLLVLDNHCSHTSLQSYIFCKQKGIHVVSIPPHTSHKLQPLDLTFFGPLKVALNKECDIFMKCHGSTKITPYDIASLFHKAFGRVATVDKATKGFEKSGIWPLNPNTFGEEDFIAADNLKQKNDGNQGAANVITHDEIVENSPNRLISRPATPVQVSVADISPIPGPSKIVPGRRITNRKKQRSEILTATPLKEQLEKTENQRLLKVNRKQIAKGKGSTKVYSSTNDKKGKKKRVVRTVFTSSSSEEDVDESKLCDDDELDDLDSQSKEICLLCGEFGANNELWFRCISCSRWAHQECSGAETAMNYICDYCL